jgi:hypothetical protein
LVSSLAFADNPADAPLVTDDGNTAVAHQQDCQDHNRQHKNKNDKALSSNSKHEPDIPSQNSREEQQSNPEYPSNANN